MLHVYNYSLILNLFYCHFTWNRLTHMSSSKWSRVDNILNDHHSRYSKRSNRGLSFVRNNFYETPSKCLKRSKIWFRNAILTLVAESDRFTDDAGFSIILMPHIITNKQTKRFYIVFFSLSSSVTNIFRLEFEYHNNYAIPQLRVT